MSDDMRHIRRQMRGRDAHETRASMVAQGRAIAERARESASQMSRYLGIGRRRIDLQIEEQFSDAWFALALILTMVGLIFNFPDLLTIAAILLTIIVVSWLWNRLALFGLEYERLFSLKRAFVGEEVELTLAIANRKVLPLSWLRITDTLPVNLPLQGLEITKRADSNRGELSTFWALKWYEQVARPYQITASERGFFRFGPARLETGDIFGLFRTSYRLQDEQVLIVYPRLVPLTSLGIPAKEPFGDLRAPPYMFEDPIRTVGIRDYRPEDDFRRVHWKATARRQALQTRVLEPASSHNIVVCLNVATLDQPWKGIIPDLLEQVVSIAASLCYHSLQQRWPTGLLANGALPRSDQAIKVLPGRSPGQITMILEALAVVTPFITAPIDVLLAKESPKLPWGSTLVVVTALLSDELKATLLDLKGVGRRVVVVSLADEPPGPELRDILFYQVPRGEMSLIDLGQALSGGQSLLDPQQLQQQAIQRAARDLQPHPRTGG